MTKAGYGAATRKPVYSGNRRILACTSARSQTALWSTTWPCGAPARSYGIGSRRQRRPTRSANCVRSRSTTSAASCTAPHCSRRRSRSSRMSTSPTYAAGSAIRPRSGAAHRARSPTLDTSLTATSFRCRHRSRGRAHRRRRVAAARPAGRLPVNAREGAGRLSPNTHRDPQHALRTRPLRRQARLDRAERGP